MIALLAGSASAAPRLDFQVVTTDGASTLVSSEAVSVTLGKGWVASTRGSEATVWDTEARTVTRILHDEQAWQRSSIHAEVALREAEQANRRVLGGLVRATEADVPGYSDAELEAAFGMPLMDSRASIGAFEAPGGGTWWSRPDGVALAGLMPGKKRIPKALRPSWAVFVAHALHLHPEVRTAVLEQGAVPASITLRWTPADEERIEEWSFVGSGRASGRPPVPPDGYVERIADRADVAKLVQVVRSSTIPSRDQALASLRDRMSGAIAKDRGLDGFLAGLEYSIQRSGLPVDELAPVATAAASDSRLDLLMNSLSASSPAEAELALRALERIKDEVRPHGRVVDVFAANHLVGLGRHDEGYRTLRDYLQGQPISAGPLHDLGLILSAMDEMGDAWRCFELARAVDDQQPLVLSIDTYEEALMRRYPWFY